MKRYRPLLIEAVIHPEEYLSTIEKKLDVILKRLDKKNYTLTALCMFLSDVLSKHKIDFIGKGNIINGKETHIQYGINEARTQADKYASIRIYCNVMLLKIQQNKIFKDEFKKWLMFVLKHELIHRGQNLNILDLNLRKEVRNIEYEHQKKELSEPEEIMARSWEIIELFKLKNNFSNSDIKNYIRDYSKHEQVNNTLNAYFDYFGSNSKQLKLLYKYMYMYLNEEE